MTEEDVPSIGAASTELSGLDSIDTELLKQCGDDLTRENLMKQVTSLKKFVPSLALPGMSITTGPNDYRINKQMQMMKFNGERWELFGPIIEDTGPAG